MHIVSLLLGLLLLVQLAFGHVGTNPFAVPLIIQRRDTWAYVQPGNVPAGVPLRLSFEIQDPNDIFIPV